MHRIICLLLAAGTLSVLVGFQQPAPSSQEETQIRVEVDAVNLFVTVMDESGHFVTDLGSDRFIVYEDGIPQEITNFSAETDLPLRVGLLLDTSSSVRLKLDFEKEAASRFIRSIMRRRDRALLVEFDEGVTLLHDFTHRPSLIIEKIDGLRAGGGTALWDAIFTVTEEKMSLERDSRKALVIISDGEDRNSKREVEETLRLIQAAEVTAYTIGTQKFGASSSREGQENLENLAEGTGGRAFFPYSVELLDTAFDQIDKELRSQYSITYTPRDSTGDGEFREIEVRIIDGGDYKLRHRQGYWGPRG